MREVFPNADAGVPAAGCQIKGAAGKAEIPENGYAAVARSRTFNMAAALNIISLNNHCAIRGLAKLDFTCARALQSEIAINRAKIALKIFSAGLSCAVIGEMTKCLV